MVLTRLSAKKHAETQNQRDKELNLNAFKHFKAKITSSPQIYENK